MENKPTPSTTAESSTQGPGQKLRIIHLKEKYEKGERKISEKTEKDEVHRDSFSEYALSLTEAFDKDGKPTAKTIRINSPHVCKALQKSVKFYPVYQLGYDPPVEVKSPFALLFHHLEELTTHKEDAQNSDIKDHLTLLLNFLSKEPGAAAAELVSKGLITFKLLWAIFKPGAHIFTTEHDYERLFWLQSTSPGRDEKGDYLRLDCLYTAYDGTKEGKARTFLKIYETEFPGSGHVQIESLSKFPLTHLKDRGVRMTEATRQNMIERGKEYLELEKNGYVLRQYQGFCLVLGRDHFGRTIWDPYTTAGRVLIDTKAFMEENASEKIRVIPWTDDEENNCPGGTNTLCPPYAYGYCLGMRTWCCFFLKGLSEVKWEPAMFPRLRLPSEQKDLVLSMVSRHSFTSEIYDDDALKGKGLVVILHGPPGTGKTLTAVAVAEEEKMPLLLYPAGDLGNDLDSIQSGLKRIVRHATRWRAVLLVDEADVFLESRQSGMQANLERNALVAVFLRQLEYSQGVIFLTSNRAQTFDAAIKSRTHLTLYYPPVNANTRRQLWEDHLKKIPEEKRSLDVAKTLDLVTKYALNGREISNMVSSAVTLAKYDSGDRLTQRHLEDVLKVWEESNTGKRQEIGKMILKLAADLTLSALGLFVLLGLATLVSFHGYQVFRNRDILILYR